MSVDVANGPQAPASWAWKAGGLAPPLLGVVGLATLFALSGAFDTDHLAPVRSAALWLIVSTLLVGQAWALDWALMRRAPQGLAYRMLAGGVVIVAVTLLMAAELNLLKTTALPPDVWGHDRFFDLVQFIAPTVAVVAGLTLLLRRGSTRAGRPGSRASKPASSLAAQDPLAWPDEPILWVRADDHYLEVATASRTLFLRGRLSDAVARLQGAPGLQVHRSWWVARAAVTAVRREGREHVLVLGDGVRAPVGRSRRAALRAQGWLTPPSGAPASPVRPGS